MKMTRRQFLGTSVATVALAACGGDDDKTDAAIAGRNCATNGTTATISANHQHTINVTFTDISAGVNKTYDIQGSADHTHSVTITAANFATLQSNPNGSIMVTSSDAGHTHQVTVLCA
jgi:hypothetical protein